VGEVALRVNVLAPVQKTSRGAARFPIDSLADPLLRAPARIFRAYLKALRRVA
jgi:hypothetical protein